MELLQMQNVLNAAGPANNEYPVYPEQEGEWDRPLNPYSPH
jgi:hypothetical protein